VRGVEPAGYLVPEWVRVRREDFRLLSGAERLLEPLEVRMNGWMHCREDGFSLNFACCV